MLIIVSGLGTLGYGLALMTRAVRANDHAVYDPDWLTRDAAYLCHDHYAIPHWSHDRQLICCKLRNECIEPLPITGK